MTRDERWAWITAVGWALGYAICSTGHGILRPAVGWAGVATGLIVIIGGRR